MFVTGEFSSNYIECSARGLMTEIFSSCLEEWKRIIQTSLKLAGI